MLQYDELDSPLCAEGHFLIYDAFNLHPAEHLFFSIDPAEILGVFLKIWRGLGVVKGHIQLLD